MRAMRWLAGLAMVALLAGALLTGGGCGQPSPSGQASSDSDTGPFIFGVILVGPYNDRGWSAAHYEAGKYVEAKVPGTRMIYVDNVNPGAKPGVTIPQVVDDLVAQGARLVFTTSDDFKDGTLEAARRHPEIKFVNISGDHAWREGKVFQNQPNLANLMGRMEYGKAIAGYAAGLTTQTGKIGYLGPLINDETRRLAASAYLGARRAWVEERGQDPARFEFKVVWIGFWFNIAGQTLDPTKVAREFYSTGYDVVISGIDTTEALVEAGKLARAGKPVWAIPYDYRDACAEAPEVALGVPYFNWGPGYVRAIERARSGNWQGYFEWDTPDWADLNNPDRSAIGFARGAALTPANAAKLDAYIAGLGNGSIPLFRGPLRYQDGSEFLADGVTATDQQIWYLPQLLQGMTGASK